MASLTGAASRLLLAARITGSTTTTRLYFSSSYVSPLKCPKSSPLLSHVFRYQKQSLVRVSSGSFSTVASPKCAASDPDQLKSAREDIKELLKTKFCHPILGTIKLSRAVIDTKHETQTQNTRLGVS
ncbi:L-ascorbate peroxidase T, chloroplastic [Capsicum chinense]|nr:L-ascorbate peroxidase T, chloroplastic [Capsicum chinense]